MAKEAPIYGSGLPLNNPAAIFIFIWTIATVTLYTTLLYSCCLLLRYPQRLCHPAHRLLDRFNIRAAFILKPPEAQVIFKVTLLSMRFPVSQEQPKFAITGRT